MLVKGAPEALFVRLVYGNDEQLEPPNQWDVITQLWLNLDCILSKLPWRLGNISSMISDEKRVITYLRRKHRW